MDKNKEKFIGKILLSCFKNVDLKENKTEDLNGSETSQTDILTKKDNVHKQFKIIEYNEINNSYILLEPEIQIIKFELSTPEINNVNNNKQYTDILIYDIHESTKNIDNETCCNKPILEKHNVISDTEVNDQIIGHDKDTQSGNKIEKIEQCVAKQNLKLSTCST